MSGLAVTGARDCHGAITSCAVRRGVDTHHDVCLYGSTNYSHVVRQASQPLSTITCSDA